LVIRNWGGGQFKQTHASHPQKTTAAPEVGTISKRQVEGKNVSGTQKSGGLRKGETGTWGEKRDGGGTGDQPLGAKNGPGRKKKKKQGPKAGSSVEKKRGGLRVPPHLKGMRGGTKGGGSKRRKPAKGWVNLRTTFTEMENFLSTYQPPDTRELGPGLARGGKGKTKDLLSVGVRNLKKDHWASQGGQGSFDWKRGAASSNWPGGAVPSRNHRKKVHPGVRLPRSTLLVKKKGGALITNG